MISLLQVENYLILESSFKSNSNFNPDKDVQISIEVNRQQLFHESDPHKFSITMRVIMGPGDDKPNPNFPWSIDVVGQGFFKFIQLPPSDGDIKKYIDLNAMPILYSLIRGYVSQATALGPSGRFIMPTLNFKTMAEEVKSPEIPKPTKKKKSIQKKQTK
jgi:preprotein translocase subunit SecB